MSPELMEPYVFDDLDEWEECQPGDPDCEEVEIDESGQVDDQSISLTSVQVITTKSPKVVSLDELDEWEECSSLGDDCELVEINDEDDDDDDEEEDEVLRDTLTEPHSH
jgi:hypothetical protein